MADPEIVTKADSELDLNLAVAEPLKDPKPETSREPTGDKTEDDTHEKSAIGVNIYENNGGKEEENKVGNYEEEEESDNNKEAEKHLLEEESVKIDIIQPDNDGEDTATLPLGKKKQIDVSVGLEKKQREKLPVYLFPCTRIKDAWSTSTSILQFLGTAVCIIFQTVGWFTCVGGVPFVSLLMLIIGSIYVDDCKAQPNIPVYLIVSGVIGTIQHVLTIWTKYVPKESQGRLKVYRSYCRSVNGMFHLFLMIWFIIGCVWVYSLSDPEYIDTEKSEYCHKTVYLFSFWILNLSFILLGMLVVLSICFLVCVVATPKDEEKGIVQ